VWWLCRLAGKMLKFTSWLSSYDCTVPAVGIEAMSSWKTTLLFATKVWIWDTPNCPTCQSTHSLTVIWPWRVIMGPRQYHNIAAQTIFTVGIRHSGVYASSGVLQM
jgi:hypothetical protein